VPQPSLTLFGVPVLQLDGELVLIPVMNSLRSCGEIPRTTKPEPHCARQSGVSVPRSVSD